MKKLPLIALASLWFSPVHAEEIDFDFKDPKGVNMVSFHLDSPLEPFGGFGYNIAGTLGFDPENPKATSGSIELPTKSIVTSNPKMTEHLHGEKWLNAAKNPTVSFTIDKVTKAEKTGDNAWALSVNGSFKLAGVTKPLTTTVNVSYIPDGVAKRGGGKVGDLLVVRSDFTLKRSDFGIMPGQSLEKVAEKINVKVGITGYGI